MNKNMFLRLLSLIFVTVMVSSCLLLCVTAAPDTQREEPLTTLSTAKDLTVSIWYDKGMPDVSFIAPSGKVWQVSADTQGMKVLISAEYALVQIESAEAGKWKIRYSMGENTEFDFSVMGTAENIWIQYINVTPSGGNHIDVAFLAERGEESAPYSYYLYLTYEGEGASQVLLEQGEAYTGEEFSQSIDLSVANSFDKYKLYLEVELRLDGVTLFDQMESESFSFENTNKLPALSGMDMTVNISERMLTLDWEKYRDHRYNAYRVIIFGGAGEQIFCSDLPSDQAHKITQYISESYPAINVSLYGISNGILSEALTRTVTVNGGLELLTKSPTSASQLQIKCNIKKDTPLKVKINDVSSEFISAGKEDTYALTISNGNNTLYAEYTSDDVRYILEEDIFKDGFAPTISFYEPYANMSFPNKQATLIGSVGDAVEFYVNGSKIDITNGQFSFTLELADGENKYLFEAIDTAGNKTSYPMTLYGGTEKVAASTPGAEIDTPIWIPLVIGGVVALLFIILAIVLTVKKKKLKAFSSLGLVVFFAFVCVLTLSAYIYQLVIQSNLVNTANSYSFSLLVSESIERAYALLTEIQAFESVVDAHLMYFIISLAALVVAVGVHVTMLLIRKSKSKKQASALESNAPEAPAKSAEPAVPVEPADTEASKESEEQSADGNDSSEDR